MYYKLVSKVGLFMIRRHHNDVYLTKSTHWCSLPRARFPAPRSKLVSGLSELSGPWSGRPSCLTDRRYVIIALPEVLRSRKLRTTEILMLKRLSDAISQSNIASIYPAYENHRSRGSPCNFKFLNSPARINPDLLITSISGGQNNR